MDRILFRFDERQPAYTAGNSDIHMDPDNEQYAFQPAGKKNPGKTAYLTFDDGPSGHTPALLDLLRKNDVPAAFFVSFLNEDTPEKRKILKREADEGHAIGVHTFSHDYFYVYANEDNFLRDFKKMRDIIRGTTGIDPKISRFPGGTSNIVSHVASCGNNIMPRLVSDVESMGFKIFDWNAGGQDAQCPSPTTRQLIDDILAEVKGQENLIILLHDTFGYTIDAVPELVRVLRSQGYVFKKLTPDAPGIRHPYANKDELVSSLRLASKLFGYFLELMESTSRQG
jgi:peptidoglycan/xylan/chitin deacetylase (PgdA/CDA1 family)